MNDIPQYNSFIKLELVDKGWSGDKKYYTETTNGEKLLLRLNDIDKYNQKKKEFEHMRQIANQGIPMSQPIDFGICNGGKNVYVLLTWVEGKDAEEILPKLSINDQYTLGLKAGTILRKIHSITAPDTLESWESRFNRKIDRKIKSYQQCGIKFDGDKNVLSFIEQHRYLLNNRPQTMQHGDYHIGNIIINHNQELSIIDFNRFDFGDPWEEFNRIVWCAECSKHFASGRIDGYFEHNVPLDFFKLLALYIASNTLSSIPWAIPYGENEINTMLNQAKDVLAYYNNMTNIIPSWYTHPGAVLINH